MAHLRYDYVCIAVDAAHFGIGTEAADARYYTARTLENAAPRFRSKDISYPLPRSVSHESATFSDPIACTWNVRYLMHPRFFRLGAAGAVHGSHLLAQPNKSFAHIRANKSVSSENNDLHQKHSHKKVRWKQRRIQILRQMVHPEVQSKNFC